MGVKVVLSDITKAPSFVQMAKTRFRFKKSDNKSKQYMSTLEGIKQIDGKLEKIIIIKMRSDMSLDFTKVLEKINKEKENIMKGGIVLQYFHYSTEFTKNYSIFNHVKFRAQMPDLWFVGRGDVLKEIFQRLYDKATKNAANSVCPEEDIAIEVIYYFNKKLSDAFTFGIEFEFPTIDDISSALKKGKMLSLKPDDISFFILNFIKLYKYTVEFNKLIKERLVMSSSEELEHSIIWRGDLQKDHITDKDFIKYYSNRIVYE